MNEKHALNRMTEIGLYMQTPSYCLFKCISLRYRSLFVTARVAGQHGKRLPKGKKT
ncbi:hypothetical protein JCM19039_4300 [Geomicrobium sp. JCM 19039]|nr:hypothetical protein JCM19039_4300 [Geomicrobium sp. JCM 19039]